MTDRFRTLAKDAFDNYREYEPMALTEETREAVYGAIVGSYVDTGNNQSDYEALRDAIERVVDRARDSLDDDARDELNGRHDTVSITTLAAFKAALGNVQEVTVRPCEI